MMSASSEPISPFGPFTFELTPDEAHIAASLAALRRALAGGLSKRQLAPLAAFGFVMAFASILALTGLVSRRHGEIALLLAATAFMLHRLASRRRFLLARRESAASIEAIRSAGVVVVAVDKQGLTFHGAAAPARWNFVDCVEAEDAGGMIYLWPRAGAPAFLPTRAFPSAEAAADFVNYVRVRMRAASAPLQLG
jgi:hypothetical protein